MKDKKKGLAILIVIALLLIGLVSCNVLTDDKGKDKNEIVETPKGDETEKNPQDEENDNSDDKDKESKPDQPSKEEDKPSKPVDNPTQPEEKPVTPPNNNGDNNKPNNPQPTPDPKPEEPNKPAHSHDFQPVYKTVHHDAVIEEKWVVDREAWDEQVPKYKWVGYDVCNGCGKKFYDPDEMDRHDMTECGAGYSTHEEKVQDGYETIHHEAEGHYEKVVVKEAWNEQVLDYYQCSCGKIK